MKNGKKVFGAALFLCILLALLLGISWLFVPKDNTREAGIDDFLGSGYLGEPKDTLDVLFLGDSVPKFGIMPTLLWQQQGYPSYVAATAGEALPKNEEVLDTFFRNQSPKVVLLETNTLRRGIPKEETRQLKLEQMLPVLRYHDNWKFVPLSQMLKPIHYECTTWEKGYYLCKLVEPAEPTVYEDTGKRSAISSEVREHVKKIRDRCREEGAELILFSMPTTTNMSYADSLALTELGRELEIRYLDMNLFWNEIGIDWAKDTVDEGDHLNYYGAKKCTAFLGGYLAETGLLEDKRGNAVYEPWEDCCRNFDDMARKAAGNTGLEGLLDAE